MSVPVRVTDHAILRYLERAHGLDVDAVRRHIEGRVGTAVELGAIAVTVENVKLVLHRSATDRVFVTTALRVGWPGRRPD